MKRNFRIALYGPAGSGKDYLCKKIMADSPSTHRYAFADAMKIGIADILGFQDCFRKAITDNESEHFKDNYCIDLGTLKVYPATHPSDNSMKYVSASELYEMKKHDINMKYFAPENKYNNVYITIREFLVYFGNYICKPFINKNIWINSVIAKLPPYDPQMGIYGGKCIVTDLRFPEEYEALKKAGFLFIKVNRPDRSKIEKVENIAESHYGSFVPDYIYNNYEESNDNPYIKKKRIEDQYKSLIDFINTHSGTFSK